MENQKYLKSPLNYVGGKYKLLPELIPLFPNNINTFVDLFGGGFNVGINVNAEQIIYNDINYYVSDILKGIYDNDLSYILETIYSNIKEYNLPKQDGFLKLRNDYNSGFKSNWIYLYILSCYSFNWQIRFNNKHKYNSSWGKDRSSFTNRQKEGLIKCKSFFDNNNIIFKNSSFSDFNFKDFDENDLIYCDPPYLASIGNYNDGKRGFEGWTEKHEEKLLNLLDKLDKKGVRFALSNNFKYDNPLLKEWSKKYKIYYLNHSYNNCNYQKKDKNKSKDKEVLIINYN